MPFHFKAFKGCGPDATRIEGTIDATQKLDFKVSVDNVEFQIKNSSGENGDAIKVLKPTIPVYLSASKGSGPETARIEASFEASDVVDFINVVDKVEFKIKNNPMKFATGIESPPNQTPTTPISCEPSDAVDPVNPAAPAEGILPDLISSIGYLAPVAPFSVSPPDVLTQSSRFPNGTGAPTSHKTTNLGSRRSRIPLRTGALRAPYTRNGSRLEAKTKVIVPELNYRPRSSVPTMISAALDDSDDTIESAIRVCKNARDELDNIDEVASPRVEFTYSEVVPVVAQLVCPLAPAAKIAWEALDESLRDCQNAVAELNAVFPAPSPQETFDQELKKALRFCDDTMAKLDSDWVLC